ncbi:MAG: lyase [Zoogloeaceae bacterium]|nr:lyase [Zoogloeaceae bacterium]MCP5252846.1 lyase [Zoogloeaceae bacterium]MCP5293112.1 lyase [Zoogloeaceae bacterium]MCW5617049.1 lyase [Rhodocyclaceae bacterium]
MQWKTLLLGFTLAMTTAATAAEVTTQRFAVPQGARPHDVAPAPEPDGPVWYTAQGQGALGVLYPQSGKTRQIPLGSGSAPHGVIVGPDGAPWVTDGGLNAIVRVDPESFEVTRYPLPQGSGYTNLNTAAFDAKGILWFTGQSGIYGRLDPATGALRVFDAPRGRGPYGIASTPAGDIYYASLAGSHIARIDTATGEAQTIEPPTPGQGARRVWSDSDGRIWVSEWLSGQLSRYDPKTRSWQAWKLPGEAPRTYAVYVDEEDKVWVSDFGANAMLRFDPASERFESFPSPERNAAVRQILGRAGEVWVPESGTDHLMVYRWK